MRLKYLSSISIVHFTRSTRLILKIWYLKYNVFSGFMQRISRISCYTVCYIMLWMLCNWYYSNSVCFCIGSDLIIRLYVDAAYGILIHDGKSYSGARRRRSTRSEIREAEERHQIQRRGWSRNTFRPRRTRDQYAKILGRSSRIRSGAGDHLAGRTTWVAWPHRRGRGTSISSTFGSARE